MIGLQVSKSQIDNAVGAVSINFLQLFDRVGILKKYFDATPDLDLTNLGYTSGEVATIKTAINDLAQLKNIWEGSNNLISVKDFTLFVSRLWGVGL